MTEPSDHTDRLEHLLASLVDRGLSSAERDELELSLLDSPAAQQQYVDYMAVHSELSRIHCQVGPLPFEAQGAEAAPPERLVERVRDVADYWWGEAVHVASQPISLSVVVAGLFVTSIVLSLALLVMPPVNTSEVAAFDREQFVARVIRTQAAQWTARSEIESNRVTDLLRGQRLELQAGLAEIEFDSGARLVLEAPATLVAEGDNVCRLEVGRLVARVERASAKGFVVETPLTRVVDLGTEFAVEVAADGETELHVFEGAIQVGGRGGLPLRRLVAGESRRVSSAAGGPVKIVPITESTQRFVRAIVPPAWKPDLVLRPEWDTFVLREQPTAGHAAASELLVKHNSSEPRWEREAWLRFDLTDVERQRLASARLVLHVGDGIRHEDGSAVVLHWDFEVLAVDDEFLDDLPANEITWSSTRPAQSLRSVARFRLADETPPGHAVTIGGVDLTRYLRDQSADASTLIIRRATGAALPNVVHGFASSEQGDLGPALQLRYQDKPAGETE